MIQQAVCRHSHASPFNDFLVICGMDVANGVLWEGRFEIFTGGRRFRMAPQDDETAIL
jgi:hypothetical protein